MKILRSSKVQAFWGMRLIYSIQFSKKKVREIFNQLLRQLTLRNLEKLWRDLQKYAALFFSSIIWSVVHCPLCVTYSFIIVQYKMSNIMHFNLSYSNMSCNSLLLVNIKAKCLCPQTHVIFIYILPTFIALDLGESHFIELGYFLFSCSLEIKKNCRAKRAINWHTASFNNLEVPMSVDCVCFLVKIFR